ncbi:ferredoxin [Streptomyces sp. NPDC007369]|uniref:ferredoxin n=1 Tax=Streptomyces sp. NPDC007369 TaxID=3154589 RepID=UPI0033DDFFE3
MRVDVDFDRCEGHGLCEEAAPDLFRMDDEGDLVLLFDAARDLPDGQDAAARSAVRVCPIGALRLRDTESV